MVNKILLITTGNTVTNPRLTKEYHNLISNYEVDVCCFKVDNWSKEISIMESSVYEGDFVYIDLNRRKFIYWSFVTSVHYISKFLTRLFPNNLKLLAYSLDKRSIALIIKLKDLSASYDLLMAHNLGALFPAYIYSIKKGSKFSFDIEDWHPQEHIATNAEFVGHQRRKLMRIILRKSYFITYASPFYRDKLITDLGFNESELPRHDYISNAFSKSEFDLQLNVRNKKIKFVWFSQNIAEGRGLELFIPEMFKYKDQVSLTLIGNVYESFKKDFLDKYDEIITYKNPLPSNVLNKELCNYDIGLAIDLSQRDENRKIAITNKILAYTQAGLYILATDTIGHQWHLNSFPNGGICVPQNWHQINGSIRDICNSIERIRREKKHRFDLAQKRWNQELEAEKFLPLINASFK